MYFFLCKNILISSFLVLRRKNFGLTSKKNWLCCQKRLLIVLKFFLGQTNLWESLFFLSFPEIEVQKISVFQRKNFAQYVKTAFHVSVGTVLGNTVFLEKLFFIVFGHWAELPLSFSENLATWLSKLCPTCPSEQFLGKKFFS